MPPARPDDPTALPALTTRLSRREWAWVGLGLAVWIALGAGGFWFVHALTQAKPSCAGAADPQTTPAKGGTAPGNSFNVLTGPGTCK